MLKFEKYQGAGNDFIIFDERDLIDKGVADYNQLAINVCNRNYGIGADGMIILKYVANYPYMLFYNADGSQAPMCGNGIRCFAQYLKNNNLVEGNNFTIKTVPGDMIVEIINKVDDEVMQDEKGIILSTDSQIIDDKMYVKVNMGKPIFDVKEFINTENNQFLQENIEINGKNVNISYIFMGTDHSVIFVDSFDEYDIDELGKEIENFTELFPKRVNVNFVKVLNRGKVEVITWERGAGRTLACGTGATASIVLAKIFGYVDEYVETIVPGGSLFIEYSGDREQIKDAYMTGPTEKIAEGMYFYKK